MKISIRAGSWKLLTEARQQRFELYDLNHDGAERHDLSGVQTDRSARMAETLKTLYRQINRAGPTP